jgi:hypothetical protein
LALHRAWFAFTPCARATFATDAPGSNGIWLARLYRAGRLGEQKASMKLLPVRVSETLPAPVSVDHRVADLPRTLASRQDKWLQISSHLAC